ncbi:HyaD/HybD family hydrogenase maturation endopeptidase [Trichlorobacter ammonificans]|uniref:Hydrogenase maturation protease n=1 Tax=Trichlorobacter ammonificans TaxID=2916410 RepID=A0ABM9D7M5_9BACT|nr:HyaD/HybD family hydrogenase maturation endopeptidase [Trichlorobacter ammonificans]CAH2031027.1 Hydrogenase maturation protease [Trichlorobacter ammonificans]
MKTLILGLGNTIMTDDGVGPKVIERLRHDGELPVEISLLDGGTLGLDLLPHLEGVERLIIVDAVETGKQPGSLVRLAGDEVPAALETKLSPHQMGLKDLLAVARLMDCLPPEVVLVGVQPDCLELGTELTPAVAAQVPELARMVCREVRNPHAATSPG